eukprot:TRINITY_DN36028_c0_g1_i1.p1 TRINITY_DN36028_c0_g1~~TRINITY_DN36028_c0_g1_i1.p1  ORF type:complete len:114 (-),score=15.89 TRINITY_DN36028_c0_g1_i1:97-438(-)
MPSLVGSEMCIRDRLNAHEILKLQYVIGIIIENKKIALREQTCNYQLLSLIQNYFLYETSSNQQLDKKKSVFYPVITSNAKIEFTQQIELFNKFVTSLNDRIGKVIPNLKGSE